MSNFESQFARFNLNDKLKSKFVDFETIWQTEEVTKKSYKVITVVNNDTVVSIQKLQEDNNAKLA